MKTFLFSLDSHYIDEIASQLKIYNKLIEDLARVSKKHI